MKLFCFKLRVSDLTSAPLQRPHDLSVWAMWTAECWMLEAKVGAEAGRVNSLKKKPQTLCSDSPRDGRLIVLLGWQVLCGALRMDRMTF